MYFKGYFDSGGGFERYFVTSEGELRTNETSRIAGARRRSTYEYQSDGSAGNTSLERGIVMCLLFFLGEDLHGCVLCELGE